MTVGGVRHYTTHGCSPPKASSRRDRPRPMCVVLPVQFRAATGGRWHLRQRVAFVSEAMSNASGCPLFCLLPLSLLFRCYFPGP